MRVALIPPMGLERYALQSDFHMALAIPVCVKNASYMDVYKEASALGHYIIADNGVAENVNLPLMEIDFYTSKFNPNEIVLPDVLDNREKTVSASTRFLERHKRNGVRYMAVLHGKTVRQIVNQVTTYVDEFPEVRALGLPRSLLKVTGNKAMRIDVANAIYDKYKFRFDIHLLGTDPTVWVQEVKMASKYAPTIRSVDSSMPFNYAIAGEKLDQCQRPIMRSPGYYFRDHKASHELIMHNIQVMREWANNK